MTFTYSQNPGNSTAQQRKDAVRILVGDTDENDQQIQDEEIVFALSQTSNNVYSAGALVCRLIAAKYARLVDTTVDETGIRARYDQRQKSYRDLAKELDSQARTLGTSGGLGIPVAGGITYDDVRSVVDDNNRVQPVFRVTNIPETRLDTDQE